jgi:hypothetical protein
MRILFSQQRYHWYGDRTRASMAEKARDEMVVLDVDGGYRRAGSQ